MFCAYTRPRYPVSVYRIIGPLVYFCNFRSFFLFIYLGIYIFQLAYILLVTI